MSFVIIVPGSGGGGTTPTGISLPSYRHLLADQIGIYHRTTVTSVAASGEAARVVLAEELRDDEAGYEFLGAPWVYVASGDQNGTQRRMIGQPDVGYQGNYGGLVLSRPHAAALANGTVIEVTNPLPVKRHMGIRGLDDFSNEALDRLPLEVRLSTTGNGTYSYDLSAYPSISPDMIRGTYDTTWNGTTYPSELSAYVPRLVVNGPTRTLVTGRSYATSETFEVSAIVRASDYVYDGSDWGFVAANSQRGLLNDTYQAAAPEHHVVAFGMVKALQHLSNIVMRRSSIDPDERKMALADLMLRRQQWTRAVQRIVRLEFPPAFSPRKTPLLTTVFSPTYVA